jgi:hypothetical protein
MKDTKEQAETSPKTKKRKNYTTKSKPIGIRYTLEERKQIQGEAEKLQVDVTTYLKTKIENGTITVRYIDKKFEKMIYEINMIGRNLRHAVALFYKHNDPTISIPEIEKILPEISNIISSAKGMINDSPKNHTSNSDPKNNIGQ